MNDTSNHTKNSKYLRLLLYVILVILMPVLYKYLFKASKTSIEAKNYNLDTILPDHSHLLLKKGALLFLPKEFNKKNRTIILNGEAYCEIAGKNKFPFIIKDAKTQLQTDTAVLDVSTGNSFTLVVSKGKVSVTAENKEKTNQQVNDGEKLTVNAQISVRERNRSDNYLFWKTNEMVFINKPLESVIAEMNQYAETDISFSEKASDELRQKIVNLSFRKQTIDDMVKELCTVSNTKFVKKGTKFFIKAKK